MDDLLQEFLTETSESLDVVDVELVKFEQNPNNRDVLDNIFRLVHTVKGTCGFLGLPRLESVAHASETLLGKFRDGDVSVTPEAVTLILESLDRIKEILATLEQTEEEPAGDDGPLIELLAVAASGEQKSNEEDGAAQDTPEPDETQLIQEAADFVPEESADVGEPEVQCELDELEAIFQATPGPDDLVADEQVGDGSEDTQPEVAELEDAEPENAEEVEQSEPSEIPPAAEKVSAPAVAETGSAKNSDGPVANQSIRVNVDVLEQLMTMVSELVLTRNQLLEMVRHLEDSEFKTPLQRLSAVTAELQEGVMKTRMQPIGNAWQKLPRIARDLGRELDKKIELEMVGAETELDRQVLDLIKDPLTHMVRNSADHGLETTADRLKVGKPEAGKVRLAAYHEGGQIIVEISDDGAGLPIEKIKSKVIANGLASEADIEAMSEQQINRFIFHPGFSTAKAVTNVSGRGVGMDVVRSNIELIGGTIDLWSKEGKGTTFTIKIPLTLAIISALIVQVNGQRFAMPQLSVVELVRTRPGSDYTIERVNTTPVLRLRDKLLPLVDLSRLLESPKLNVAPEVVEMPTDGIGESDNTLENGADEAFVIVTQVGDQTFGVMVDEVFDTEEIVVKPVSSVLRDIKLFSGNTILGDGTVIMILDPNGIAGMIDTKNIRPESADTTTQAADTVKDDVTSLLLFEAGDKSQKAVPLSLITRLEEFKSEQIEQVNGQQLVQYRGTLMPLIRMDPQGSSEDGEHQPALVFTEQGKSIGIMVDRIVDIVDEDLNIDIGTSSEGLIGSAVVKGKATEIVDVGYHLKRSATNWFRRADQQNGSLSNQTSVLFIDDSSFFRELVTPHLRAAGYKVTSLDNATEALKLLAGGEQYDLIISDIEMPDVNGLAFATQVRADASTADIPLIAMSSRAAPHEVTETLEAGFDQFVKKFDRDELLKTLEDVMDLREQAA